MSEKEKFQGGLIMKIVVGSDHAGFELKQRLLNEIIALGNDVIDQGSYDSNPVDFPDIAQKVCQSLRPLVTQKSYLLHF